jgi:hypothetical protein
VTDLSETSDEVTNLLGKRSTTLEHVSLAAKILAALGTAVVAYAKFQTGEIWPQVGTVALAVIFTATVFVLWADKNSSAILAKARAALDKAIGLQQDEERKSERRKADAAESFYIAEIERWSHFQAARDLFRAILEEEATPQAGLDEVQVVDRMLQQARRSLFLAHGFAMTDFYTICVYQRMPDPASNKTTLVCRAHIRAIDCNVAEARTWREGVGIAGCALARREEVVVPDLAAPELGSLYELAEKKPSDDDRYRSIVAEPIGLGPGGEPWGVLVATSSVPGHFSTTDRTYVDVTESVAGMFGLAIKLVRSKQRPIEPTSQS